MKPEHQAYMKAMRTRHISERAELRAALSGRRPELLKELARRHFLVEEQTRRVLERMTP